MDRVGSPPNGRYVRASMSAVDPRGPRRFSTRVRVAMALASGGTCVHCGEELQPGWHGDHTQPWSKGGQTVPANGQASCPTCNLKRGADR